MRRSSAASPDLGEAANVAPGWVHPQLAPGLVEDRPGQAVVVRVGVCADEQADVAQLEPDLAPSRRQLARAVRVGIAGVDEDDALAGPQRPRVAMRDARPGRQPQPPDAGQHPLAATDAYSSPASSA